MKIGILSMQRICNYGSFLQAWALQHLLQGMGHEVCFVDYTPGPVLCPEHRPPFFRFLRGKLRSLWQMRSRHSRMLRKKERNEEFQEIFQREYLPLLGLTGQRNCRTPVDLLVIGSDEVFHCMQSNPQVGYAKELFGEGNQAKRVVSFAASFGATTLSLLKEKGIEGEIEQMLSGFSALSVRDRHSWEMVKALTGREAYMHIDPVLLYDFSQEIPQETVCKDTIIVYAYSGRMQEREIAAIQDFARKHKKELVSIGTYQPFCQKNLSHISPFSLLAHIRDADYIITDTFHGCVYALKYHKPFCVFSRPTNREKIEGLLEIFCEKSRNIEKIEDLEMILGQSVKKEKNNSLINRRKWEAIQYLENQCQSL